MDWWVPIPWVLAVIFGCTSAYLAWQNFRRNRLFVVSVVNIHKYGYKSHEMPEMEHFLAFDFFCQGADLYGVKTYLEVEIADGRYAKLPFKPEGVLPDPMKNGQHVRFKMDRDTLLTYPFNPQRPGAKFDITDLPSKAVLITVYISGERLIKRVSASKFKPALAQFDLAPKVETSHSSSPGLSIGTMDIIPDHPPRHPDWR